LHCKEKTGAKPSIFEESPLAAGMIQNPAQYSKTERGTGGAARLIVLAWFGKTS
jgi:hypothetical protein